MRGVYMYDDAGKTKIGFMFNTTCDDENEFDECMLMAKGINDCGYAPIEEAIQKAFYSRGHDCMIEHEFDDYWLYHRY